MKEGGREGEKGTRRIPALEDERSTSKATARPLRWSPPLPHLFILTTRKQISKPNGNPFASPPSLFYSVTNPPATSLAWPASSTTHPCTYEPKSGTYG